jgi:hypothetical protein
VPDCYDAVPGLLLSFLHLGQLARTLLISTRALGPTFSSSSQAI